MEGISGEEAVHTQILNILPSVNRHQYFGKSALNGTICGDPRDVRSSMPWEHDTQYKT